MVTYGRSIEAVYLHSAFRSGSTWFWNRFRVEPGVMAFYEPFNEKLSSLTGWAIAIDTPGRWNSRHPVLAAPYNAEYKPLLRPGGGVRLFEDRFSYAGYFDTGADEPLARYLDGLAGHARQSGALPVFGFCRSQARVPWFQRYRPGLQVTTVRNPWDQWASYHLMALETGSAYFEFRAFLAATIGRGHRDVSRHFADLHLPPLGDEAGESDEACLEAFFVAADTALRFRIFLRVYILDSFRALAHADLVVDLDKMSGDAAYRARMTSDLRVLTGLPTLSFEDCALPRHPPLPDADYKGGLEEALQVLDRLTDGPSTAAEPQAAAARETVRGLLLSALARVTGAGASDQTDVSGAPGDLTAIPVIDRFTLCHMLYAVRRMGRRNGDPGAALDYLRLVYVGDFERCQQDLIDMADMLRWWNSPDYALECECARILSPVLVGLRDSRPARLS
ncbi:MAG: hypothetical protein F8N37_18695 [Telmatospirillum sp.]|nr:hypothetical protein [Telmatospirillum sp.]